MATWVSFHNCEVFFRDTESCEQSFKRSFRVEKSQKKWYFKNFLKTVSSSFLPSGFLFKPPHLKSFEYSNCIIFFGTFFPPLLSSFSPLKIFLCSLYRSGGSWVQLRESNFGHEFDMRESNRELEVDFFDDFLPRALKMIRDQNWKICDRYDSLKKNTYQGNLQSLILTE